MTVYTSKEDNDIKQSYIIRYVLDSFSKLL